MIPTWRERLYAKGVQWTFDEQRDAIQAEIADLRAALATARASERERYAPIVELLKRYRKDTPLGHQPHMISSEVDDALAALKDAP